VRHNQVVPWRRLVLFAVLLVVGASLVSAMEPRNRSRDDSANAGPTASQPPAPVVEGSLPGKEVRARVGDVVRLLVSAPSADVVELSSLAVEEPVDAGQPAELVFVADRAGRFRVRLRDAGESIGTLRVTS
jgi:hypothetical protein